MRPEGYDLIEAVRALGIELNAAPPPKCLRIAIDPELFWLRLIDVKKSLDAFDKAGGASDELHGSSSVQETRMKRALDAVLRLYELQGGSMDEASSVIRDALELEASETEDNKGNKEKKKKKKAYVSLPVFAPENLKKKSRYKARIKLLPKVPGSVSMDALRSLNFDVSYVEAISGNTLQKSPTPKPVVRSSNPFKSKFV